MHVPEISALDVSQSESGRLDVDADTRISSEPRREFSCYFDPKEIEWLILRLQFDSLKVNVGSRSLSSGRLSALAASVGKSFLPINRGNLLTSEGWGCLHNVVKVSMISYFRHPNKKAKMIFHAGEECSHFEVRSS